MPELYEEGGGRRYTEALIKFAKDANEIVTKFGRFPQRNELLGRESTPEEVESEKPETDTGKGEKPEEKD